MKHLVLPACALALSASFASAADLPARNLPARAAPVIVPLPLFTGFYVGLGVGGGWSRDRFRETSLCQPTCPSASPTVSASGSGSGAIGGAYAGFNWRYDAFVFGLEADFNGANIGGTTTIPESEPDNVKTRLRAEGSVRARMGYVIGPVLAYLTGGVAFGEIRHTYSVFTNPPGSVLLGTYETQSWRTGWTLGGGLEWAFAPLWTARVEYRYSDYGRHSDRLGPPLYVNSFEQSHRETFNTIRVGVTRYF